MPSFVLQDKASKKFLEKTDAWGHTLTDDLQRARVYLNKNAANRTATNTPLYAKGDLPEFELIEVKIAIA